MKPLTQEQVWQGIRQGLELAKMADAARFKGNPPPPKICNKMVGDCGCGGQCEPR